MTYLDVGQKKIINMLKSFLFIGYNKFKYCLTKSELNFQNMIHEISK